MKLLEKMGQKKFFIFNLVLLGMIFGSFLTFLSFSCSTTAGKAQAESSAPVTISQSSLSTAGGLQKAFNEIANKVLPSIVEVNTVTTQTVQTPQGNGIPWEFFFGPQGPQDNNGNGQGKGRTYQSEGLGSGILVRHKGDVYYVLTNYHVIKDVTKVSVTTYVDRDNTPDYDAKIVGYDERKDLALVSFQTKDSYPLATLGNSDNTKVGDICLAIGNPLGYMFSVTQGIVSAVGRTQNSSNNINDFIQTDAAINQGNSGGALVNINGEVIGINDWIASNGQSTGNIGLGFAIPINNAKNAIDDIIENGKVESGWLGVSISDGVKDDLEALGLSGKKGALAVEVYEGSPAFKAGIRPGDFITSFDGKNVTGATQLTLQISDLAAGQKCAVDLIRAGKEMSLSVTIEKRDDKTVSDSSKLFPGVYATTLTDQIRTSQTIDKSVEGVIAGSVDDNGPAAVMGLQAGNVITGVNGVLIRNINDYYEQINKAIGKGELWFTVNNSGKTLETMRYKLQ
jgi:Do/DeqQ family serine protease